MCFFKRVTTILDMEGVKYEKKVVAKVIEKYFPRLPTCAHRTPILCWIWPAIDEGIFVNLKQESVDELFNLLINRKTLPRCENGWA